MATEDAGIESVRQRTLTTTQTPIWELPDGEQPVEGLDQHGEPDPAYATALGLVPAPLGRRALAALIDVGVFGLLQLPFVFFSLPVFRRLLTGRITWHGFVNHPDFLIAVVVAAVTVLLTIIWMVAQLFMQGRWGFTIGKLATGLRMVNVATLGKPGFWRTTWRALVAWLPVVTVLGTPLVLASPAWSAAHRRRGWHDRAGATWVVDARDGLNPFDKKRMRIARKIITSPPRPRAKSLPSLATTPDGAARSGYRPGARTSAGVLGAARPHDRDRRLVVGLSGLEPGESAPAPADGTTGPRLGSYLVRDVPGAGDSASRTDTAGRLEGDPATAPTPGLPPSTAPPQVGTRLTLVLDNGERIALSGPVVVGRSPRPIGGALPLTISDPGFSMSKTHALLRPLTDGLEVIDQGSTNGTLLVHEGQEHKVAAGEIAVAGFGDKILIGDRTITVLAT